MPGSYFYSLVQYTGADNIMEDAVERHVLPEAVILRNPDYIVKMSDRRWKYSYTPPTEKEHLLIRNEMKNRSGWEEIDAVKYDRIFQLSYFSHCGASNSAIVKFTIRTFTDTSRNVRGKIPLSRISA